MTSKFDFHSRWLGGTRTKLLDIAVEFLKLCWLFALMAAIGVILAWRM